MTTATRRRTTSSTATASPAAAPTARRRPSRRGTPSVFQPVPAPATTPEFLELLEAGLLIDLGGRPLTSASCTACGGRSLGETCPRSLPCTQCLAQPGQRCRRPSGHDAEIHANRITAAEEVDLVRELRGDPALPAPWPRAPICT